MTERDFAISEWMAASDQIDALRAENERLREEHDDALTLVEVWKAREAESRAEIERLRIDLERTTQTARHIDEGAAKLLVENERLRADDAANRTWWTEMEKQHAHTQGMLFEANEELARLRAAVHEHDPATCGTCP